MTNIYVMFGQGRDWLFVGCERGHDWQHKGGCNAACELNGDCCCSVPVHECSRCRDCDYGDNEEAHQVRAECRERRE